MRALICALASLALPASAQLTSSLPVAFQKAEQAVQAKAPRTRGFGLEYWLGRWHLVPDTNPPGTGLVINVTEGEHVRLSLTNSPLRLGADDSASFAIDGLDATVDGKPVHGIDIWLPLAVGRAEIEFDAPPGDHVFLIYAPRSPMPGPAGRIVVSKK